METTFGQSRISEPFGKWKDRIDTDPQCEEVEWALAGASRGSVSQMRIKRGGSCPAVTGPSLGRRPLDGQPHPVLPTDSALRCVQPGEHGKYADRIAAIGNPEGMTYCHPLGDRVIAGDELPAAEREATRLASLAPTGTALNVYEFMDLRRSSAKPGGASLAYGQSCGNESYVQPRRGAELNARSRSREGLTVITRRRH